VIVDAERGLVLTNHHVIKDAESRNLRTRIAAPQELAQAEGRPVPQLPGMRMVEIERGSPLSQRIQGLVVTVVEQGSLA